MAVKRFRYSFKKNELYPPKTREMYVNQVLTRGPYSLHISIQVFVTLETNASTMVSFKPYMQVRTIFFKKIYFGIRNSTFIEDRKMLSSAQAPI